LRQYFSYSRQQDFKKKQIKPHLTKTWCIGVINAVFISAMENILRLYRLPYDEQYPVVCFDERPCFLIGDVVKGLELKPRQVYKQHYEYEKNGSCCLLLAIEPLTGKRIAVSWKFSLTDARRKLNRHYVKIIPDNEKYKDKFI